MYVIAQRFALTPILTSWRGRDFLNFACKISAFFAHMQVFGDKSVKFLCFHTIIL